MFPLIMAGIMAAQSFEQGKQQKMQAKIDKVTMQANVRNENKRREAENILAKARGDLARFQQARSNKYKLRAGAENAEAQTTNLLRLSDAAVRGTFEARIAAAETAGALAAQVGFAGVGGGTVDMLNATTKLRQQRVEQLMQDQADTQAYDLSRNIDQTREATILGLDDVQFFDNINFMTAQEQYIPEPSWGQIGLQAGMAFAQSYASMGGFDGLGKKLPNWFKSTPKTNTINAWGDMPGGAVA